MRSGGIENTTFRGLAIGFMILAGVHKIISINFPGDPLSEYFHGMYVIFVICAIASYILSKK